MLPLRIPFSADRYFLDSMVDHVFELREGICHEYRGNYSYFIEKRREELNAVAAGPSGVAAGQTGAGSPAAAVGKTAATAASPEPSPAETAPGKPGPKAGEERSRKTKEEKRQEAEERNRISRATASLKQKLKDAEERIAALEAKQREGEAALCEPDIYKDPERIKTLNVALKAAAGELEDLYYKWNDLTLKIEALEESLRG